MRFLIMPQLSRVILFVRDVRRVASFYEHFFDLHPLPGATDDWIELASPLGGSNISFHKTAATRIPSKAVKLVFGVADVSSFKAAKEKEGLKFGVVHHAAGFDFADTKDPAGNAVQISSRGLES